MFTTIHCWTSWVYRSKKKLLTWTVKHQHRNPIMSYPVSLCFRNRVRHVDEHFDLDLTYITERIIGKSWVWQSARKLPVGGLQPISRDTDNNAAMYNCWWTNKRSSLEIFCFHPPTWRLWRNVKTTYRPFLQLCLVTWPLNESEAPGDLVMITDPKKDWIELLLFKRWSQRMFRYLPVYNAHFSPLKKASKIEVHIIH